MTDTDRMVVYVACVVVPPLIVGGLQVRRLLEERHLRQIARRRLAEWEQEKQR